MIKGLQNIHCVICRWICGHEKFATKTDLPFEIREASHKLANASAVIQGSARRIKQEADVLTELTAALQRTGGQGWMI
jgi:hypothetical protein